MHEPWLGLEDGSPGKTVHPVLGWHGWDQIRRLQGHQVGRQGEKQLRLALHHHLGFLLSMAVRDPCSSLAWDSHLRTGSTGHCSASVLLLSKDTWRGLLPAAQAASWPWPRPFPVLQCLPSMVSIYLSGLSSMAFFWDVFLTPDYRLGAPSLTCCLGRPISECSVCTLALPSPGPQGLGPRHLAPALSVACRSINTD